MVTQSLVLIRLMFFAAVMLLLVLFLVAGSTAVPVLSLPVLLTALLRQFALFITTRRVRI